VTDEVAVEGSQRFSADLALALLSREKRLASRVDSALHDGDLVQSQQGGHQQIRASSVILPSAKEPSATTTTATSSPRLGFQNR
jgi:hypothetical protein